MSDELLPQMVDRVAGDYFTPDEKAAMKAELASYAISDNCSFHQMGQDAGEPRLEIAFKNGPAIIDYTCRKSLKVITTVMFSEIIMAALSESSESTHLVLVTAINVSPTLTYTATVPAFRNNLRAFWGTINALLLNEQR